MKVMLVVVSKTDVPYIQTGIDEYAYGFSKEVYAAATQKMSLSQLTFNHQMVRLFFLEQLYRAHTILRHEKYHNE